MGTKVLPTTVNNDNMSDNAVKNFKKPLNSHMVLYIVSTVDKTLT